MARHYELPAAPESMVWGYLDASLPPVLRVASGDTVTIHSLPAGGAECLPPGRAVAPEYLKAIETLPQGPGPHFITGPVHVAGARPGDVLQIDILDMKLRFDWGFVSILPLLGTLPDDFTDYETIHPEIDVARGVARMPWGLEIDLDPFFGILGVAPPAAWGRCGSPVPRAFGGNLDNKELKPGATLYLPVFNDGALFFAGDGHAVQGDGEVCITALETAVSGTFRLTVRKDLGYRWPFAETPDALMTIGLDEDLDNAMRGAVREMISHVCSRTNRSPNQAYMLCSLVGNLRVTQTVDGNKGIHMLLEKRFLR
jgi:acetamidase/formamidase